MAAVFFSLTLNICASGASADSITEGISAAADQVADPSEMTSVEDVEEEGMTPLTGEQIADGVYPVLTECSSSMFPIENCLLTVESGKMTAKLYMGGKGYLYVYPGTAEDAAKSREEDRIPFEETEEGTHTFTIPVEALDKGFSLAAYSKKKEKWYDRTVLIRADSLPASAYQEGFLTTAADLMLSDGVYEIDVTLEGGSGKASVASPASLTVKDGECTAEIIMSSSKYDYMVVNGERYDPVNTEGNSTFIIPVSGFDYKMPVAADTTAMSRPHEISYTLFFDSSTIREQESGLKKTGSMDLYYAEQFAVDYCEGGAVLLTIGEDDRYVLLPPDAETPEELPEEVSVIRLQPENIYLASSSVMDYFRELDALSLIRFTGTKQNDWSIPEVRSAMEANKILFAGKYSSPDYELLLGEGCGLAIENTMIYHNPETLEMLERIGIPVIVEKSSYEKHPLGRLEWIRLYGLLTGKSAEADVFFEESMKIIRSVSTDADRKPRIAFFYLTSSGYANVRRPGDYITKMIEMSGGLYAFDSLESGNDESLSSVNMQMESFYEGAKDADILIYNSTIAGELNSLDELLGKSGLLEDFKAVREGRVWCTNHDMFQQFTGAAEMMREMNAIFYGKAEDEMSYFYRLK